MLEVERKLVLPCSCVGTCSIVLVTEVEEWNDDPREFVIEQYTYVGAVTWRRRLKVAWNVLRGREEWTHGVCLTPEQGRELAEFLTV